MKKIIFLFLLLLSRFSYAADIEGDKAILRSVDKVTGHTATSKVMVGKPAQFNNLRITVDRCLKKPPEETPENAAFLLIEEKKDNVYQVIFKGWMFSSNPALSAMEHPIFDIWLLSCEIPAPKMEESMSADIKTDEEDTVSVETLPSNLAFPKTENEDKGPEKKAEAPNVIED